MRPFQEIAALRAENVQLLARIDLLEGQLAVAGLDPYPIEQDPDWALALNRQERTLMGALISVAPRALDAIQIDEVLPHRDVVADRDLQLARVIVGNIRRKLGADVVETVPGRGYRLGAWPIAEGAS